MSVVPGGGVALPGLQKPDTVGRVSEAPPGFFTPQNPFLPHPAVE